MDTSLPDRLLAADMVEDPAFASAPRPGPVEDVGASSADPDTVFAPPTSAPAPADVSVDLPPAAFKPVAPPPAARPSRSGRADHAEEPSSPAAGREDADREYAGGEALGSRNSAQLAAMPPPPPVSRAPRANMDLQQKGVGAAKADNAPIVLDKIALAAPAAAAKDGSGGVEVQLIAVSRRDQAVTAWSGLVERNTDLLGGLEPAIVGGDGRGSLFRLRAGPLGSAEQAQSLCASLKRRDVDCVVVHQGG